VSNGLRIPIRQTPFLILIKNLLASFGIYANSTVKSPSGRGGEDFLRGFKAENFSGPVVEQALDFVNLGRVEVQEGAGFGQVLPDQSVCVFVQAALPGVIGGGEIHRGFQAGGDFLMTGELLAIVGGEGQNPV
jgi:hypothetical protein